ncbi:hypothetical protein, partial [Salmonella enterica]|uniref:hypothetical protein n=1 Tax=Salmonella enterica TaxID=28901 RepID=UPI0020A4DB4C
THESGQTSILCIGYDVSEQVASRQAILEREHALRISEERFRNTVLQAPVGIAILRGAEFVYEIANQAYLSLIDKAEAD